MVTRTLTQGRLLALVVESIDDGRVSQPDWTHLSGPSRKRRLRWVKSHDVCNSVTSRLIDQLAINNAVSASFPSTTASMSAIDSGLK